MISSDPLKVKVSYVPFMFSPKPKLDISETNLKITSLVIPIFEGVETSGLEIFEEDCEAELTGYFKEIFDNSIGHSPSVVPIKYEDFVDRISIAIPIPKVDSVGSIALHIPINLIYENSPKDNKRIIVKDYVKLSDRVIERWKGETQLYSIDLKDKLKS